MYAELHCLSNFTFLRGASRPEELVAQAITLGYRAIALTDECSFAGVVKAHVAAKDKPIQLIIGSEFLLTDDVTSMEASSVKLVLLAPNRIAYTEISALITRARRRSAKGEYQLFLSELQFGTQHCLAIWLPAKNNLPQQQLGQSLKRFFKNRLWLGVELLLEDDDQSHYNHCYQLARTLDISMVACNDAHMHCAARKPLQDVLTAIRLNTPVPALGSQRQANGERYLHPIDVLQKRYPQALLDETLHIAQLCEFSLDELRYEYPKELVPKPFTPSGYLRELTFRGARERWPQGVTPKLQAQLDSELALIAELEYEYYFLTVEDIVRFARQQKILCQGRGSAANSAVCYCLFITEVNPAQSELLFERFISRERNEPPDIDVDFEHERREEVIQYIYRKYTRKRAALAATVITYRPRSAIRDVGKALGLDALLLERLAKNLSWWDQPHELAVRLGEANIDPESPVAQQFLGCVCDILGFPRHLSQHVGGFIITRSPTSTLVPIENAAMKDRTIIQWDKEDIEALGLLKVDVLALGMLTAIRKTLALINRCHPNPIAIENIPNEDPKTYQMLSRGDSVGVFQVESRAQMSMLPRLRPQTFYDLVIEVAIVRPGPIQGNMVHPYLRRRNGDELVTYPNDAVKSVLERTLGVPIFQEQVIKLVMVAAGFSGGEADKLRRAMATWGRNGNLQMFKDKVINGMLANGYERDFAERLFKQMQGFGEYGFPESHASSFALLVYVSAWLKCHYPAAFYCGLLNSLPMGFYSPSQLVQDAQRHHVQVLPVDILSSRWDHTLEYDRGNPILEQRPVLRLGFRLVKGLSRDGAERLLQARQTREFTSVQALAQWAQLNRGDMNALADSGALKPLAGDRHHAHWHTFAVENTKPLLSDATELAAADSETVTLPTPTEVDDLVMDYASVGLTLNRHPMAILRDQPPFNRCRQAAQLFHLNHGRFVRIAGLVTGRQRPGTASGVLFMTLEDETGNINVVVWRDLQNRYRQPVLKGKLLLIKGVMESKDNVIHVIAGEIQDHTDTLPSLCTSSRDFQ
ncbi:MAG: error-prone DNA polymerase [Exilibacterium sp.]